MISDTSDREPAPDSFGPTPEDIAGYTELLGAIANGEELIPGRKPFDPRINAELTSTQIDAGAVGAFVGFEPSGDVDRQSRLKVTQQRYIAAVLGLKVGETQENPDSGTATATVELPSTSDLPALPKRGSDGKFRSSSGEVLSQVRLDAIFAGHFIAQNREHFEQPGAFEELFERVVKQAEQGKLVVEDIVGFPEGAMSLTRQVARVLGYEVEHFKKGTSPGTYVAAINGIRKGFDKDITHFLKGRT